MVQYTRICILQANVSWGQTINEKKENRALLGIYEEFIERGVTVTFVPLEEKKSNGMIFFIAWENI